MESIQIGKKVSAYRRQHNMTIKDFSEISGVSTALLSQIERDIANPSLSVLSAIARTMGIPLSVLVEEESSNASLIMRREDKKTVFNPGNKHILYNVLTSDPVRTNVELILMTLAGEMETYGGFSEHPYEEEIAYVLSGEVTILFPEESFVLREEDTIRILPGRKHRFRNNLKETAKVLFVKCKVER